MIRYQMKVAVELLQDTVSSIMDIQSTILVPEYRTLHLLALPFSYTTNQSPSDIAYALCGLYNKPYGF